jgi:hypothetical protein
MDTIKRDTIKRDRLGLEAVKGAGYVAAVGLGFTPALVSAAGDPTMLPPELVAAGPYAAYATILGVVLREAAAVVNKFLDNRQTEADLATAKADLTALARERDEARKDLQQLRDEQHAREQKALLDEIAKARGETDALKEKLAQVLTRLDGGDKGQGQS